MHRATPLLLATTLALSACAPADDAGRRASLVDPAADANPVPRVTADTAPTPSPVPTPSPSPSPAPSFADAAVILRDDDGFDEEVLDAVQALPGVAELAGSRNDEVSLWGTTASTGEPVDAFADGFQVLVTALVDTDDLPGPRLAPGEVLLTPRGTELRTGLDVGGTLRLGPGRTELTVVGIGDDQDAYGSAELVLHPADGDAVDLEPLDRVFLLLDEDTDAEALADELRSLLGTDEPRAVEVRDLGPGGDRGRRTLPISLAKLEFGEFAFRDRAGSRDIDMDPDWVRENLVSEQVPLLGTVRCHEDMIDDLRAALQAVVDAGEGDWVDPSRSSGCWAPRRISDGGNLSKHAWGIAVDINIDFSLPGLGEVPPDVMIDAFRANGFSWGGDFPSPDNHHWEWVGDA